MKKTFPWLLLLISSPIFSMAFQTTILNSKKGNPIITTLLGIGTLILYGGEIYGAYRSALLYSPTNNPH